jgi:opacity protein-like surface antigen
MKKLLLCAVGFAALASAASAEPVRGFGRDVPMSAAMRQVVPDGWSVSYGVGVDSNQHVNWRGAEDWRQVVDTMATSRGLVVSYEAEQRTVRVTRTGDPVQRVADPVHNARGGFVMVPYRTAHSGDGWQSYAGQGQGQAVGGAWRADKDRPLRTVLAEWGERAGWQIVWSSGFDYRLQAGATFGGDFIQAAGDLLRSVQSRPALTGMFYRGNRTLVITNDNAGAN